MFAPQAHDPGETPSLDSSSFTWYLYSVMQITYMNGHRLKLALLAGAQRLSERAAFLNQINVFPVADGDTGTNMAGTVQAMALALSVSPDHSLAGTARTAAESALMGAKGSSGAILAQFFQGLADEMEREARITTRAFAQAVSKAVTRTYGALSKPREGTLLTVLKDWGNALHRVSERTDDFLVLLKSTLKDARASLARTTNMLPELRKAGVVDAGALGWVHILEGIVRYITFGRLRDFRSAVPEADALSFQDSHSVSPLDSGEASAFRYCTECMLEGESLDLESLRHSLDDLGDSVVVAGSSRRARVHIHTDVPARVFLNLEQGARVTAQKVDDMRLQQALASKPPKCGVLVDSACDLPEEERLALRMERVPLTVTQDGVNYLDRDGLSSEDFYARQRSPGTSLSTSQPSDAVFRRKLDILLGATEEVVYLGLSGALSGTLDAGLRTTAARKDADRIRVVDSKTISVAYALLARWAAEAAAAGAGAREIERLVESLRERVKLFVAVPDLSGLIKSGRLHGMKGLAARAFGLRPIITVDEEGRAASAGLYAGSKNGRAAILKMLRKAIAKNAPGGGSKAGGSLEVLIGHADSRAEAEALARDLSSEFTLARAPDIVDVSPALALHAGPGALAFAVLLPEKGGK